MKRVITFFLSIIALNVINAQPGSLDYTFGNNGIVITSLGCSSQSLANSMLLQNDGKIIIAGFLADYNYQGSSFLLIRYEPDGSLDSTFGLNGMVEQSIGDHDIVTAVGLQPNGKILAVGNSYNDTNSDIAIVRYNADGLLDLSFGTNGIVITDLGGFDYGQAISIQLDGKFVVTGSTSVNSKYDLIILRYNSNGLPDSTFGINGTVITHVGNYLDNGLAVATQIDDKIVVAGYTADSLFHRAFLVVRYFNNGLLDTLFGTDGIVITPVGNMYDNANALSIQPDGKVVVTGYSNNGSDLDIATVRYNSNGTIDNAFGTNGIIKTDFGGNDEAKSVEVQSSGKIIITGYSSSAIIVMRYLPDGIPDNTFGTNGIVNTNLVGTSCLANSMSIQNDEKIVVAGGTYDNQWNIAVVRYNEYPVEINEPIIKNAFSIYPNPVSDELIIKSKYSVNYFTLLLYNSIGQLIICKQGSNMINVDMGNLKCGIYFAKLISEKSNEMKKVIKK